MGYHARIPMTAPSQTLSAGKGSTPLGAVESILELVGRTPLLRLSKFAPAPSAEVYAKLEYMNPCGSVKDRAALGMILDAEQRGVLKQGSTIIEPTAGNTGIGLALVGVARGYSVVLCVPEEYSREKMKIMEALGGGSTGAVAAAARKVAQRLGTGKRVVTLFPDGAERYMSQGIFD